MGAENIYYEVPLTSTSAGFATSISASATAYADAGGAYNMKCVGSWFAYSALYRIAVGMPYLYGQDEILFGMNYSMKATQLSYHLAEIESVLNVLKGTAQSQSVKSLELNTKLKDDGLGGFRLQNKTLKAKLAQVNKV